MKNEKAITLDIKPDYVKGREISRIYANYFEVNHGKYDFTFIFCDVDISLVERVDLIEQPREKPIIKEFPIVAKIVIPPDLVEEIIGALKKNYEKYLKKEI